MLGRRSKISRFVIRWTRGELALEAFRSALRTVQQRFFGGRRSVEFAQGLGICRVRALGRDINETGMESMKRHIEYIPSTSMSPPQTLHRLRLATYVLPAFKLYL